MQRVLFLVLWLGLFEGLTPKQISTVSVVHGELASFDVRRTKTVLLRSA